jgi:hypothetical protein
VKRIQDALQTGKIYFTSNMGYGKSNEHLPFFLCNNMSSNNMGIFEFSKKFVIGFLSNLLSKDSSTCSTIWQNLIYIKHGLRFF